MWRSKCGANSMHGRLTSHQRPQGIAAFHSHRPVRLHDHRFSIVTPNENLFAWRNYNQTIKNIQALTKTFLYNFSPGWKNRSGVSRAESRFQESESFFESFVVSAFNPFRALSCLFVAISFPGFAASRATSTLPRGAGGTAPSPASRHAAT